MISILVVDDDTTKRARVVAALLRTPGITDHNIDTCEDLIHARDRLAVRLMTRPAALSFEKSLSAER